MNEHWRKLREMQRSPEWRELQQERTKLQKKLDQEYEGRIRIVLRALGHYWNYVENLPQRSMDDHISKKRFGIRKGGIGFYQLYFWFGQWSPDLDDDQFYNDYVESGYASVLIKINVEEKAQFNVTFSRPPVGVARAGYRTVGYFDDFDELAEVLREEGKTLQFEEDKGKRHSF